MTPVAVVQISGGAASYVAAKLCLEEFNADDVCLLFADVHMEDEDLYRFLSDCERRLNHPVTRISDGRTPWDVFFDEGMMGNSMADPCSRILKRELLDRWRQDNAPDATVFIGFDATEKHRFDPLREKFAPVELRAPLIERGLWKEDAHRITEADGIRLPRLYGMGFPHNNCGGFCVKAGQASFALLLDFMPERYAFHEAQEEKFRTQTGKDVAIMRDRTGGEATPLTMRAFRERRRVSPQLIDWEEYGACNCMEPASPPQGQEGGG